MNILLIIGFCYEAVAQYIAEKREAIRTEIEELDSICTKLSDVQNAIERTGFKTQSVDNTYYDMLMHIDMLETFEASLVDQENYLLDQIDDVEEKELDIIEKRTTPRRSQNHKFRDGKACWGYDKIADRRWSYRPDKKWLVNDRDVDRSEWEFHFERGYNGPAHRKAGKAKRHNRKAGLAAKEAMAVWNNLD